MNLAPVTKLLLTWNLLCCPAAFATPNQTTALQNSKTEKCSKEKRRCNKNKKCCEGLVCEVREGKKFCQSQKPGYELFKIFVGGESGLEGEEGLVYPNFELGHGFVMSGTGETIAIPNYWELTPYDEKRTFVQVIDFDQSSLSVSLPENPRVTVLTSAETPYFDEDDEHNWAPDFWAGAISTDGSVIAHTNYNEKENYDYEGAVRTYKWNDRRKKWTKLLPFPMFGGETNLSFGGSVALSNDGNIMVVGSPQWELDLFLGNLMYGQFQRFELKDNKEWQAIGDVVQGESDSDGLAAKVVMTPEGDYIAVNSYEGKFVKLYFWMTSDQYWNLEYTIVRDEEGTNDFGVSAIQMSDDRRTLAIGDAVSKRNKGFVMIYTQVNGEWEKVKTIYGTKKNSYFGYKFALSGDGETLAISDWFKNEILIMKRESEGEWLDFQTISEVYSPNNVLLSTDGSVLSFENNPNNEENNGQIHVYLSR